MANAKAKAAAGGVLAAAMALTWGFTHYHEGRVYRTYFDIGHVATICDGHTGREAVPGAVADDKLCDDLLKEDLSDAAATIELYVVRPEELPKWTLAAAGDFVFHFGPEAFRTSTFLRLLNERRITEACDTLLWWNKYRDPATGQLKVSAGLINRQIDERHLCRGEPW